MGFSLFFTLKHQGRDALNQKSQRRRISLILKEILFYVTEFSGPKIVTLRPVQWQFCFSRQMEQFGLPIEAPILNPSYKGQYKTAKF